MPEPLTVLPQSKEILCPVTFDQEIPHQAKSISVFLAFQLARKGFCLCMGDGERPLNVEALGCLSRKSLSPWILS